MVEVPPLSRPTSSGNGHAPPNGTVPLNRAERRRLWATRRVRMRALDEQMGEIATAISVMVLAAIEPRLAALENNGEVVIPDPGWDRGPQQTVAIDPRLLAKQAGLRRRRAAAAQRRIWGGIEGRVRQCHEVVALDNELARVDRQIFLAERS